MEIHRHQLKQTMQILPRVREAYAGGRIINHSSTQMMKWMNAGLGGGTKDVNKVEKPVLKRKI